ncbi:MAG: HAD-IB family hydrolase [Vicingaceae bacterium]
MEAKKLALFDFDGTITQSDSLLLFLKFYFSTPSLLTKSLLFSPKLIAQKLGVINNSIAKEELTTLFFKGEALEEFNQKCQAFAKQELPKIVMPSAALAIEEYQSKGVKVMVVSASFENYLKPYFEPFGVEVIATRLAHNKGVLSGKFIGQNCYGQEKVNRIQESLELDDYQEIIAYGDTAGDKPMLELATQSFYKRFR